MKKERKRKKETKTTHSTENRNHYTGYIFSMLRIASVSYDMYFA